MPTVTTGTVSDITTTTATLSASVASDGGATVTSRGFLYGTNSSNLTDTVQCGSGTGDFTANLTGLIFNTTYYYKAFATNSVGTAYGDVMSITTSSTTGTQNGHDWVDLGLPSGARWATCNVGSDTPEGYGNYYAWGETTTKTTYDWSTYRYCNGADSTLTKYCNDARYGNNGFTDNLTTLEASDDAATANWGEGWRMPTYYEQVELIRNCYPRRTTQNGVNGCLFTGPNGNSIFLPAAGFRDDSSLRGDGSSGYYWSSSLGRDDPNTAWAFGLIWPINNDGITFGEGYDYYRGSGLSVRPVYTNGSIVAPTTFTSLASNITATTATLNGCVYSDGGAALTSIGFLYGTNSSNLTETVQCGSGTDPFTANITDLIPNTTYYYKAFATNSVGTSYGEVSSFTTPTLPTVTTGATSNINASGATLSGNVTSDGGARVTSRGFLYGTNSSNLTQTVQSGTGTGSFTKALTGLTANTTYYYKAYATNSVGTVYGDVLAFTTPAYDYSDPMGYTNGHGYVDLGLPSGTRWATCNVGSDTPEGYGNYYAWGETTTKTNYDWSTYRYCNGSDTTLTKYCFDARYGNNGFTDTLITLEASDDAATANWGADWRMPTETDLQELLDNCTSNWTTQNGVSGCLFTGQNGNSIFLPAAGYNGSGGSSGYYWSSSLYTNSTTRGRVLYVASSLYYMVTDLRYYGQSVRPVCNGDNIGGDANISVPTVNTLSVSSITATTATLSGDVYSDGGATVTSRGFLYGTNSSNLTETVLSGSGTGNYTANLTGLISNTTYYYKAFATNSVGTSYGDIMSFTTETASTSYSEPTGYVNGYGYVDLGLPSGTKWATCNVGANSPTAYGNYYAWGETTPKETYNSSTYTYSSNPTTLPSDRDAATANWGTGWRMPTYDELSELKNNCTVTWTTQNGVNGRLFTGPNGNSIFLPAAGYRYDSSLNYDGSYGDYWSSSLSSGNTDDACNLGFDSGYNLMGSCLRYYGNTVRAVCQSQN